MVLYFKFAKGKMYLGDLTIYAVINNDDNNAL